MKKLVLLLFLSSFSCKKEAPVTPTPPAARQVNTAHLNSLFQTVKLASNGVEVGTVAIYSEAPDYRLVTDADEGFTCVDDVARAAIFWLAEPDFATNTDKQAKHKLATEFVLQLQAPAGDAGAGYFYNFLWPDKTINKTYKTSVAEANFWSWRALWALSEAYPTYLKSDPAFATRMRTAMDRVVANMLRDFGSKPKDYTFIKGITVPKWLPFGSGTDQAAIMLLGLANYQQIAPSAANLALIDQLAAGILVMQQGDAAKFPYGAFLSFENGWHAYAADQAYALLHVGKQLNKPDWITAARKEIDNFYPYLLKEGFLESFSVEARDGGIGLLQSNKFPQIAYGIRPMIWATMEAYDQTKDAKYLTLAKQLYGWFQGKNVASIVMYDPATGRGYDGLLSGSRINQNAGAESTIESLWAAQKVKE
ncbi:hypothetical protein [Fibrella aquatilis]|uniref:Uncharacterized protein n=1 Tax=Fibrella aquatilis TaxID=2817059 RepID=A0A939JZN5_9BACT|nr:hypothetical protein [Fibrella aquatilis]MBO0931598.1 hypothetical protein [Fibrella aquatilis]